MDKQYNRHEFFQSVARGGFLAGLFGIGVAALSGTKKVSECFNHNYCSSCWAFDGCGLPEKKTPAVDIAKGDVQ